MYYIQIFWSLLKDSIGCETVNNSKSELSLYQDANIKWQRTFFVLKVVATIATIVAAIVTTFFAIYDHIFADKQVDNSPTFIVNFNAVPNNDYTNVLSVFESVIGNITKNIDTLRDKIYDFAINNPGYVTLIKFVAWFILSTIGLITGVVKRPNKKKVFTHLSLY